MNACMQEAAALAPTGSPETEELTAGATNHNNEAKDKSISSTKTKVQQITSVRQARTISESSEKPPLLSLEH